MTNPALPLRSQTADERPLTLLFALYLALIPAGALMMHGVALDTGLAMNWDRALFWTLNSLSCTGFDLATDGLSAFSPAGVVVVLLLMLYGAFFSLSAGGIALCRFLGLGHSPRKILLSAFLFLLIAILAGTGFLMTPGRPMMVALFESAGAVANAGLTLDGPRDLLDVRLHAFVLPLAALGTLGVPVLIELFEWFFLSKPLSTYSRRVIRLTVGAWLAGFALLLAVTWPLPWREGVSASWLYAINTRSLGAMVELPGLLPAAASWVLPVLMLAGANPGSAAPGGMQLPMLAWIWGGAQRLRQREPLEVGAGRTLGTAVLQVALVLGLFVTILLLVAALLPQLGGDRLVLLTAGAVTNTGISRDPLSLTGQPLLVLSAAMVAGQLLSPALLWRMTAR